MTSQRIDKWLFHARFYRTRVLAQEAVAAGKVRLNGARIIKPGHSVKAGAVLTVGRGAAAMALKVLGLAERRGPSPEAQALYEALAG